MTDFKEEFGILLIATTIFAMMLYFIRRRKLAAWVNFGCGVLNLSIDVIYPGAWMNLHVWLHLCLGLAAIGLSFWHLYKSLLPGRIPFFFPSRETIGVAAAFGVLFAFLLRGMTGILFELELNIHGKFLFVQFLVFACILFFFFRKLSYDNASGGMFGVSAATVAHLVALVGERFSLLWTWQFLWNHWYLEVLNLFGALLMYTFVSYGVMLIENTLRPRPGFFRD